MCSGGRKTRVGSKNLNLTREEGAVGDYKGEAAPSFPSLEFGCGNNLIDR